MFSNILMPIDLAHPASWTKAIAFGRQQAGQGAELHLLGIVHDVGNAWVASYLPSGYEQRALADAKASLDDLVRKELSDVPGVHTHVGYGHIAQVILDMARKVHADLIVMESRSPDKGMFRLGSQTERVVRHSGISVLVVR